MKTRIRTFAVTLVLTAVALGYVLVEGMPVRPGPTHPAVQAPITPQRPFLTGRLVLEHEADLSLTAAQRGRLEALDREWRERAKRPQAAAETAAQELSQFLQQQGRGKATLQGIQQHSEQYRALSQELRELRTQHAEAVSRVLT